jgi:alkyl sulfatase BDS1-like metallo-beta-lactamase superfamily hydrolase
MEGVAVEGDAAVLGWLMAMLDKPDQGLAIVTP